MINCRNCNNQVIGNFCSNCGQSANLKRIDKHYISHEFLHLFHFETGFFYTAKQLSYRPGNSIREFADKNRNKHMKPVAFLFLTSIIYTLITHLTHADKINNAQVELSFGKSSIDDIQHWVETHSGYSHIIMGVFIALFVMLLFKKYQYNIFEITIILCFAIGQVLLLTAIEALFVGVLNEQLYKIIYGILYFIYPVWVIGQFFDGKKIISYIKAFFAYLFGYLSFIISIIVIGLITDGLVSLLNNH